MDSDGEHPIDKIELMLSKFDENKILIGLRENNKSLINNLISIFYKTLLSLATGYKIPQNSTDFVCFSNSIKIKLFNHFNKILYFKSVFFFLDEKIEHFNFYSNKNLSKKRSSFTLYRLIDVFFYNSHILLY